MTRSHNYTLSEIKIIRQAKIIDSINETCIKAQIDNSDDLKAHKLAEMVSKKYGLHSIAIEMLFWIMVHKGYLEEIPFEDSPSDVDEYVSTTKGISLYLNGGLAAKLKAKHRKKRLIITGQIASIIIGVYYLLKILMETSKVICH